MSTPDPRLLLLIAAGCPEAAAIWLRAEEETRNGPLPHQRGCYWCGETDERGLMCRACAEADSYGEDEE